MAILALVSCFLILGCDAPRRQASGSLEGAGIGSLPHVTHGSIDYPYIRYSESTGRTESRGQAFFLYPIKIRKAEILSLEYTPGMDIEGLFGEELIGVSGDIINDKGQIKIKFLPISLPIGLTQGQVWHMEYIKQEFICKSSGATSPANKEELRISCSNAQHSLRLIFNRKLGIKEFQDFCGNSICTYQLMDSVGLLSRATTEYAGLPAI